MDSFSDGTTQGSFDFAMCSDHGDGQVPPSVAFSPSHPTLSIEVWRDDVVRNTGVGLEDVRPTRGEEDGDGHIFEVRFLSLRFLITSEGLGSRSRRLSVAVCHHFRPRQRRSGL